MIELAGFGNPVRLGSGGLGDVYQAVRLSTGTMVAIKVLRDWSDSSVAWQRAERELRALAQLQGHPFVVHLQEVVDVGGVPHLVMEYAPGGSVSDLMNARGGALSVGEVVLVGEHTASALAASHRLGIIHLDIKPQNLLIGAFGQVKVCDFGIAALTQTERFRERTNAVSYNYSSPEQLGDGEVGPPADVYALGATLVHLLTGRPMPLRIGEVTLRRHPFEWTPPEWLDEELVHQLNELLESAVDLHPARRPSAAELHERLEALGAALGEHRCRSLPVTPRSLPTAVPDASRVSRPQALSDPRPPTSVGPTREAAGPTVARPVVLPVRPTVAPRRRGNRRRAITLAVALGLALGALAGVVLFRLSTSDASGDRSRASDLDAAATTGGDPSGETATSASSPVPPADSEPQLGPNSSGASASQTSVAVADPATGGTPAPTTTVPLPAAEPATVVATAAPPPPPTTARAPTAEELAALRILALQEQDRPVVESLVGWWVPQLSSKRVGLEADGIVYDHQAIVGHHEMLRAAYGAVLLHSPDFVFRGEGDWWITVVPERFADGEGALQWCRDARIGPDDCFAKLITRDQSIEDTTEYQTS